MENTLLNGALSNLPWALALALVAWISSRLIRRPALTHALWLVVLLKLFTPPLIGLAIWPTAPQIASRTDDANGLPRTIPHAASSQAAFPKAATRSGESIGNFSADADALQQRSDNWRCAKVACVITWLAGSVVCTLIAFRRIAIFMRLLRNASPASCDIQENAVALATRLNLRRAPRVVFLPGPISPMLWAPPGITRIVLPAELWHRLPGAQRDSLLLHELAHLKRRDHWVRNFELLATVVFWWNPLVWWARSQLRQAEEQCCDAWVTWAAPRQADDYAAALVEAVDFLAKARHSMSRAFFAAHPSGLPALASGIGQFQQLKRRLTMIQSRTNHRKLGMFGALGVCAAMAILPLAAGQRAGVAMAAAPDAKAAVADAPRQAAIAKGLDWLAAHPPAAAQAPAAGAKDDVARQSAIVSLSGLAFLGAGADLKDGPYHAALAACVDAVLGDCQESGLISPKNPPSYPMYNHGYAVLFLAETYARTHDDRIKPKLEKAVALIEKSQGPQGGWRYTPTPMDSDVSVTACVLNGLLAAKSAGIPVQAQTIKNAIQYLLDCQNLDGGFNYTQVKSSSAPPRSAAAGAVLQHQAGQPKEVESTIKYLAGPLGNTPREQLAQSAYALYYATQLLASAGGNDHKALLAKLIASTLTVQQADGSWKSVSVGPQYDTACAVLSLEAPDQKLWIFRAAPKGQ